MYNLDVLKINNFEIKKIGEKICYNTDNTIAHNNHVKTKNKTKSKIDFPHLSSPLNIVPKGDIKITSDFLGYLNCNGNSVRFNNTLVGLYSGIFSGGSTGKGHSPGFSVNYQNFKDVTVHFTVRKLIKADWINWCDEYYIPNEEHDEYQKFAYDCVVYSLFESKSNQSSLRQITYKEKLWDIKNEFFWLSKEEMMNLANDINYTELYNDARADNNRYVHNLLFGEENIYEQISPDAKLVLDKATELTRMSMTMRSHFADDHNHLNSWDAGYAQLKLVWKEYFPDEFKEFRQLYKNLEDRMRPLVYELGFLLK